MGHWYQPLQCDAKGPPGCFHRRYACPARCALRDTGCACDQEDDRCCERHDGDDSPRSHLDLQLLPPPAGAGSAALPLAVLSRTANYATVVTARQLRHGLDRRKIVALLINGSRGYRGGPSDEKPPPIASFVNQELSSLGRARTPPWTGPLSHSGIGWKK